MVGTPLLMEEILHQLRLVVYPRTYRVLYIPGGCLGFLPSTVVSFWDGLFSGVNCQLTSKPPNEHRGLRDVLNDPKHSAALATHKALDLMGGAPRNVEVLGGVWSRFFFDILYIDIINRFT